MSRAQVRGDTPELSVVVPVYNSATIFPELYRRVVEVLDGIVASFELIAVIDGCVDGSFDVAAALARRDHRVKVIELSRNFGHQAAISAGLAAASGDWIAIMDDDLEDPPDVLRLLLEAREGHEVIYGVRRGRKRSVLHRLLYRAFYRVLGRLVETRMPYDAGDFCVMARQVVEVLNGMPERNRYLRGLRAWSGFRQTGIEYDRGSRYAGDTGYSVLKYLALALDAIFSFSYKPLKLVAGLGAAIAFFSFVAGVRLIVLKLLDRIPEVPGWTSLLVSVLFLSGIQLLSIGILGEYIARIYDEVKQRPKYIIKHTVGIGPGGRHAGLGA